MFLYSEQDSICIFSETKESLLGTREAVIGRTDVTGIILPRPGHRNHKTTGTRGRLTQNTSLGSGVTTTVGNGAEVT